METNLEQSSDKNHIVGKFKDINRNNEETDTETQTIAKTTDVFPNVLYASIFKQPSGIWKPSRIPANVPTQLTSPKSQVSESDLDLTLVDQLLSETLEALCGSASTSSKFVDGRIKGTLVSDYVLNLIQKTLSPLEIKVLEKGLGFSPTSSSIN